MADTPTPPIVHHHWLHGMGPDKVLTFTEAVAIETDCGLCLHRKVCARKMEDRCRNYEMANSDRAGGCHTCIHRYTRWSREAVPCFNCHEFLPDPAATSHNPQSPTPNIDSK